MHFTSALASALAVTLIAAFGLIDLAIYGGFVEGEDAIDVLRTEAGELTVEQARERALAAEIDDSDELPGVFVPNQGRQHVDYGETVPFCLAGEVTDDCYASNPPTSGLHLASRRGAQLDGGQVLDMPPNPGVYDFAIPRESIPHIQEHAGVFVGHNCEGGACREVVAQVEGVVEQELTLGARVVMAPDPDLETDTVAMASWTRIDSFDATAYTEARVRDFIKAHSCRFDPERFCRERPLN